MTVCVLGLGQIGLPLALLIAQRRRVVGVDIDETYNWSIGSRALTALYEGL